MTPWEKQDLTTYITLPTHSARADRISQILNSKEKFEVADFKEAQLDLKDLRAEAVLSDLLPLIEESNEPRVKKAVSILSDWDYVASSDSTAACIFYPFMDQMWSRKFMRKVLSDDFLRVIPGAAPGLNRFDVKHFLHTDSPWNPHKKEMVSVITECLRQVMDSLESEFGENMSEWEWGKIHQVQFSHRLAKKSTWAHMKVEAQPSGGSPTTLAMAMHLGPGPGKAEKNNCPIASSMAQLSDGLLIWLTRTMFTSLLLEEMEAAPQANSRQTNFKAGWMESI